MKQVPFGPVRFDILQLKRKDRATINSIEELQEELDNTLTSVSGNPITISDASNTNAEDFTVTIVPTQAGTGDPSPTNVRTISGLSSVDVVLNDNTITFSLGSTVYSGSINFSTGELTLDKGMVELGDLTWTYTTSYTNPIFYSTVSNILTGSVDLMCSNYKFGSIMTGTTTLNNIVNETINTSSTKTIYLRDDTYTDVETFTSAMDGVQLLYPLATPTTTTLTAKQIRLLQGENELTTTGSSMNFKYQRDNLIGELKAWVLDQLS